MHFKGFMSIHMRKLHAECQIPADVHDWCQIVFFNLMLQNSFRNIEQQKNYRNFLGDRLEVWPSIK